MAVDLVGIQSMDHLNWIFQMTNHDFAVSNFKQAVSILNRTGHARFRRRPSDPQPSSSYQQSEPLHEPPVQAYESTQASKVCFSKSITTSSTTSSLASSVAGDGSASNGKQLSSSAFVTPAPVFSSRKPPLPSSHRKRCADRASLQGSARDHSISRSCHCCKRRKLRVKVAKVSNIPADNYSWKKYGEKTIEWSPYPRVYYKCSSGRGCPARKRVEMAHDDSKMLIITYEGEHRHSHAPASVPTYLTVPSGLKFQSK